MTLTEEEAKTKLCPRPVAGAVCVASGCMVWEFERIITGYCDTTQGTLYENTDKGYCSLGVKR